MNNDGSSVLIYISQLKQGDPEAARSLWERYSDRMQRLARMRMKNNGLATGFDEEDVVLSAFDNFCRVVQQGRYFHDDDPHNLWALLAKFTVRKLNDKLKIAGAAKRGGDKETARREFQPPTALVALEDIATPASGPESTVILADEYRRLFQLLDDPQLERVAVLKLEGYTNDEVAQQLGYTRRTIQRMLNLIRSVWQGEQGESACQ